MLLFPQDTTLEAFIYFFILPRMGVSIEKLYCPPARTHGWQWPNIVSVDAALVAIVWQQWLQPTQWVPMLVLGLSVWLIYTADRWLDVRALSAEKLLTERHRFARRWHRELVPVWLLVLAANVALALTGLSPAQLIAGSALLAVSLLYCLTVHRHRRVPKEILVALIFAAGAGIFQIGTATLALHLTSCAVLFLLAFANCSLIAFREVEIDRQMERTSFAQQYPASRQWALHALMLVLALGLGLCLFLSTHYVPLVLCGGGLLTLGLNAERLHPELFRVLADALLLLPALSLLS